MTKSLGKALMILTILIILLTLIAIGCSNVLTKEGCVVTTSVYGESLSTHHTKVFFDDNTTIRLWGIHSLEAGTTYILTCTLTPLEKNYNLISIEVKEK